MRALPVKVVVVSLLLAPVALSLPPVAAQAATLLSTFSADPLPTWQTNGAVWALETVGDVVYVGGVFTKVRPPGTSEGSSQSVTRNNLAAFDARTGNLLPCNPSFTFSGGAPKVFALDASPSGDRLYVGGSFSHVGSTGVGSFVALNPATCSLLSTATFQRPNVSAIVRAVSATSTNVYVGGDFASVNSQSRNKFAALSSSGSLLPGSVNLDGSVRALLALPDHNKVLVGGDFLTVNGSAVRGLVAVHPTSSAVVQTFPGWIPASSVPKALTRDATGFYVGAEGTGFGIFDGRIAGDLSTMTMRWKDYCLGATQALVVDDGVLYSGHHTHECSTTPGGWLEDGFRNHLTGQDVTTKELIPTFFPDTNDGIGTAPQGPRALVVSNDVLWVGGEFTKVNEASQRGLTRFGRTDTGAVTAPALTVSTSKAGANVVTWATGFDRDEDSLTYQLFRDDVLVDSQTTRSREWSRRQMSFVDTGVSAGQSASYRVRVIEPDGDNVGAKGSAVTVTTSSTNKGYRGAVLADSPSLYWKLDETTEQLASTRTGEPYYRTRVLDSSGNSDEGTAERGYTTLTPIGYALGGASALSDGSGHSITFDGAAGRIAQSYTNDFRPAVVGPSSYSVELWFRTTGSTGGRLAGFGDRRTELYERVAPGSAPPVYRNSVSARTDRQLYLSDSGKLVFGTLNGSTKVTTKSVTSYNDRQWHHAVGTSGPQGMRLYADGVLVGSSANTSNGSYTGWWRVGYDTLTGWADKPANTALKGGVDEFAVYPYALSATAVAAHRLAGRPGAGPAPAPVPPDDTTTLTPVADTFVNSAQPTTSFGSSTSLISDSDPQQIGYLRFQLPSAPSGRVLQSAVLRLRTYTASSSSSTSPHLVQQADDNWSESTVTWSDRPALVATTFGTIPAGTGVNTSYDVPLDTAKVAGLLGSQSTFALVPGGSDSLLVSTREGTSTARPQLVLGFGGT